MLTTYLPAIQNIGNQHPSGSRVHYVLCTFSVPSQPNINKVPWEPLFDTKVSMATIATPQGVNLCAIIVFIVIIFFYRDKYDIGYPLLCSVQVWHCFNDTAACRKTEFILPLRHLFFTNRDSLWYFPYTSSLNPAYRASATSIQLGAGWWLHHSSNMACLRCVSSEYFFLISLHIDWGTSR